jgi:hypothetical protein
MIHRHALDPTGVTFQRAQSLAALRSHTFKVVSPETWQMGNRSATHCFPGRWFDDELILLCLRWYCRFKLSYRDLILMLSETRCGDFPYDDLGFCDAQTCEKRWQRPSRVWSAEAGASTELSSSLAVNGCI